MVILHYSFYMYSDIYEVEATVLTSVIMCIEIYKVRMKILPLYILACNYEELFCQLSSVAIDFVTSFYFEGVGILAH